MAEPAADLFRARMNPMAEIDRLFGADGLMGIEIVKVGHHRQKQDSTQSPGHPSKCIKNFYHLRFPDPSSAFLTAGPLKDLGQRPERAIPSPFPPEPSSILPGTGGLRGGAMEIYSKRE